MKEIIRTFAVLIQKDGGIGPCDVLATCAYKVLHSTWEKLFLPRKISEASNTGFRI